MVYTRKSKRKTPLTFSTGGVVPVVDPPPPPPIEESDPIKQALQAQLDAERLARENPPRNPVDDIIDSLEGLSDHKRDFLRRNPWAMEREMAAIVQRVHKTALDAGIPDDTPEMDTYLVSGVDRELTARIEKSPPAKPLPPVMQPPPPAPPRRHVPVSAPVTREVMTSSGKPLQARPSSVTLTAEERAIARNSFGYGGLSNAEKERLYALNKAKYQRMREDGTYTDERGG